MRLADRWLSSDSAFMASPRIWTLGLASLLLLGPALLVVAVGFAARLLQHHVAWAGALASSRALPVLARVALTAAFVIALVDLTRDTLTLL